MASCPEVSIPVTNFNFKKEIERNPKLKAIANYCFAILEDSKAKGYVVVQNIDLLLYYVDYPKELDHDDVSLKIVPDNLDSVLLNKIMNQISRDINLMENRKQSIEWEREVFDKTIKIANIMLLLVSVGLLVAGHSDVIATLTVAIKAIETYGNDLSKKERTLEGDMKVIEMMRDETWQLVHEFNNVQQMANTLNREIEAELWKLKEHSERMEESGMKETIKKIKRTLKDLKSIVNGYGNKQHEFSRKFTNMVRN